MTTEIIRGAGSGATFQTITLSAQQVPVEIPISSSKVAFVSATLKRSSVGSNASNYQFFYADGTTPASKEVTMNSHSTDYDFGSDTTDFVASNKLIFKATNTGNLPTVTGTVTVVCM